ncbi:DinB family protein (plasmid) [Deinococcus sp. KNUC1210]|uniref:DinB family protein n=1 Tax=Deinococcus sp. KNUC1210 TaxID=2917691 RepID=UPI001EEF8F55|nr:DinB family protein [Deinococcus sp. KNUC1210]ULH17657.1 DinB family protein [Deinococcus sp. KNUC1210]
MMDPSLPLMYDWVKRTRERLFEYTEALPNEVYVQNQPSLPASSLRDIHVHVADMYLWWIGRYCLGVEPYQRHLTALPPSQVATHAARTAAIITLEREETLRLQDVAAVRAKFLEVDALMEQAFATFDRLDHPFEVIRASGRPTKVTQRWALVSNMTHEFHHKGQMLAFGRALGYPLPEDIETDMALP